MAAAQTTPPLGDPPLPPPAAGDGAARGGSPHLKSDAVEMDKTKVDFTKDGAYKFYPDNPENHRHKYRWLTKEPSKFYDPCEQSRQALLDCILRNQDDRLVCQDFFDAYRECRKDFLKKKRQDRRDGVRGWNPWR